MCLQACAECIDSDSFNACAKSYLGIFSPLKHSTISNESADIEGPDQTARMRRLIWAFAVRICPKTRFRMARSIYRIYRLIVSTLIKAEWLPPSFENITLSAKLRLISRCIAWNRELTSRHRSSDNVNIFILIVWLYIQKPTDDNLVTKKKKNKKKSEYESRHIMRTTYSISCAIQLLHTRQGFPSGFETKGPIKTN